MTTLRSSFSSRTGEISSPPPSPASNRSFSAHFPAGLFFLTVFVVTSRGLLENVIGKTAAYGAQGAIVVVFMAVVLGRGRPRATRRLAAAIALWWLLVLAALLSILTSADVVGAVPAITYSVVMLFFATLMVVFSGLQFSWSPTRGVGPSLAVVAVAMMVVAVLQQYAGLTWFPGTDLGTFRTVARPSAMTGSFLHYPIALGLMAFLLLGVYVQTKRRWYLVIGLAGLLAVLVSYSRSGMVIVLVGLSVAVLLSRSATTYARIAALLPLAIVALVIIAPSDNYFSRFLSIFQTDGAGNTGRIGKWELLLGEWSQSPLLIGAHAGQYTNITANLSATDALSPESGFLQLLISFGLIGAVTYYALMAITVRAAPSDNPWFRAGLIAAICQSFVYQSVEVLPFMVLFAATPLIAGVQQNRTLLAPLDITSRKTTTRR